MEPAEKTASKHAGGARPQTPTLITVKPGELPSVLRTSAEYGHSKLAGGLSAAGHTEPKQDADKQAAGAKGLHMSNTDLLSTANLPRLDPGSAARHHALPAQPPKSASPPRPNRGGMTPERFRGRPPDALPGSRDASPAACSASAAARRTGPTASCGKRTPDAPAVGSVAMSALPASYYRKLGASEPDASWLAGAPSPPALSSSQQQHSSPREAAMAAACTSVPPADDVRLLRPVDPAKPGYYWKPVMGITVSADAQAAPCGSDNILGFQVLQEVAGCDGTTSALASHTRQRMSMLLRLPLGTEHFLEAVPAVIQDKSSHACLLVLPSDKPSNRKEALAVETLLAQLLQEPASAVMKACQWRAATLAELCSESLGAVAEALKQKGPPRSWQFQHQHDGMTGHVLGAGMLEALDGLMAGNDPSTTAVKMASLINTKEAAARVGAAAAAAAAAAAEAVAPASLKCPVLPLMGMDTGAAVAAAAEVAAAAAMAAQQQQQQKVLQQQQHRSSLRHQLQLQALAGEIGIDQQLPSSPSTSRSSNMFSSRSVRAEFEMAATLQTSSSSSNQQQQLSNRASSPPTSQSGSNTNQQSPLRRTVLQHDVLLLLPGTDAADSRGAAQAAVGSSRSSSAAPLSLQVVADLPESAQQPSKSPQPRSPSKSAPFGSTDSPNIEARHAGSSARHMSHDPAAESLAATCANIGPADLQHKQQQSREKSPSLAQADSIRSSRDRSTSACSSPTAQNSSRCSEAASSSPHPGAEQPVAPPAAVLRTPRSPGAAANGANNVRDRSPGRSPTATAGSRLRSASLAPEAPMQPASPADAAAAGMAAFIEENTSPKGRLSRAQNETYRSASGTGSVVYSIKQLSSTGAGEAERVSDEKVAVVSTSGHDMEKQQSQHELSSLYGLALAAAICMADLVRQVEVACVERGRALVHAWNCSMGAAESALVELQTQNKQLLSINSKLVDEQQELAKEFKGVEFLRREAMRFRKELDTAQAAAAASAADNTTLRARLDVAEGQVTAVEAFVCKRLARLRWRNAFAVLGTWSRQSTIQSGGARSKGSGQLLAKVVMLEKMVNAVNSVEHRKLAWGRNQKMEKFEFKRPQMHEMVQVMTVGPQVAAPGRVHDGYNIDSTVQMLTALTPEARTMVLATLPPVQRWKIVEAMKDEERASMVIAMSVGLRKEAAAAVDPRLWERTMDIIRTHSSHAARYLTSMDIDDAASEFLTWGQYQQMDVLGGLDTYTAAGLLTRTPEALRKELLSMMEPYVAANIVQAMMPPPAAQSVDSLDMKKAMAILLAMDPTKAADVLTEMGSSKAAVKLMHMDADARNSIIESMAPRAAASTLASMEDALQEAQVCGGPDSPELLSLNGAGMESPAMDTMMELNAENAFSIMSYMTVQDKAALLANMDPEAVARLLGLMDPNEAVVLLSALGDGNSRLVSHVLSSADRERMIEVLQSADCSSSGGKKGDFAKRARKKGSFRDHEREAVQRLVDVYEKIEAGAMDDNDEEEANAVADAAEVPTSNVPSARPTRSNRNTRSQTGYYKPQTKSIAVQVGSSYGDTTPTSSSSPRPSAPAASCIGTIGSRRPSSNVGFLADHEDDEVVAAASSSKVAANKAVKAKPAVAEAKKIPVNAKRVEERRISNASADGDTDGAAAAADGSATGGETQGSSAGKKGSAKPPTAAKATTGSGAGGNKGRKTRATIDEIPAAAPPRASQIGSIPEVPPLPIAANDSSMSFEETPPSSSRHVRYVEEDGDAPSGDNTPRAEAASSSLTTRSKGSKSAAASVAAGRKALRDALKPQAAAKQKAVTARDTSKPSAAAAPGTSVGALLKEASQFVGNPPEEEAVPDAPSTAPASGLNEAPAQSRLGKLPKNARLIEAMGQHKNAKPKPKGWLMAVVDSVYKEGETLLRKLGRTDMIKKQSVPEIVFAYFHNKYGQRALVNENVGSLVNTLALYQRTDLRLEAFARLLSEEWDVSIFLDFLNAQNMCTQPAKLVCIEYPREASKDEQYPWVCLYKAVWVADSILGMRAQAARNRFNEFLHMASMPADDADVERLRRERREAASKDAKQAPQEELPESFFKLPRIRFLLILCKEILRINKYIASLGEEKFAAMDVHRTGSVSVVLVRGFVKTMSPTATDAQVSDNINAFVSTAEGFSRDIPPEQVAVASVTELNKDAFVAGVTGTQVIREHIKLNLLHPAHLEQDDADAQVFFNLITVIMSRHSTALLPYWQQALDAAGDRGKALHQLMSAVIAAGSAGDAWLKSYVNLLLGLINTATQSYLDSLLGSEADVDSLGNDQLEDGLTRLEDAALILVGGCAYLLDEENSQLALARMARLPLGSRIRQMGRQLLQHRRMQDSMLNNAANVLQRVWRRRQQQLQQQRAEQLVEAAGTAAS